MRTEPKPFEYGVGALVILAISIGLVIVVYAGGLVKDVNLLSLSTWLVGPLGVFTFVFGPIGVYTLAYSLVPSKDSTYYLVWGTIMFATAIASVFYSYIFIVAGILIIVLAVIGLTAYMRSRK